MPKPNFLEKIALFAIKHKVQAWFNLEKSLVQIDNYIVSSDLSPAKTWPNPDKFTQGGEIPFSFENISVIGKYLKSSIKNGEYSIKSALKHGIMPKTTITDEALEEIKEYAKSIGIDKIGFTKIPTKFIFKERAIQYDNAMVLIMEMDKESISKAPSIDTFRTVFQTYDALGIAANKLCAFMQEKGFGAQASHPLGGLVLYPPLAQKAGLGWLGKHGLLITPEFGARQRISAIFTNISNLPFTDNMDHEWIGGFCDSCNKCIRTCPPHAILDKPIIHESLRKTHIDRSKCLPYFVENKGCSVCLKDCVFSSHNYYKLKGSFEKNKVLDSNMSIIA